MIINIQEEDWASELKQLHGSRAKIWLFSTTFSRLAIIFERADEAEVVFIVGVGCESINGPFAWKASKVIVEDVMEPMFYARRRVRDVDAKFELTCSSVLVLKGPLGEFGTSLNYFVDTRNARGFE